MLEELWADNGSGDLCSCGRNWWNQKQKEGQLLATRLNGILPVACGRYEVYAAVHPGVWDPLLPVDVDFLLQVGFILVVDELHNGQPADKRHRVQE